jgi:hypothetical protein
MKIYTTLALIFNTVLFSKMSANSTFTTTTHIRIMGLQNITKTILLSDKLLK